MHTKSVTLAGRERGDRRLTGQGLVAGGLRLGGTHRDTLMSPSLEPGSHLSRLIGRNQLHPQSHSSILPSGHWRDPRCCQSPGLHIYPYGGQGRGSQGRARAIPSARLCEALLGWRGRQQGCLHLGPAWPHRQLAQSPSERAGLRPRGARGWTQPGGGALRQAWLWNRGDQAQAGHLQPGIQRSPPSTPRGPSNAFQEPAEAGGLQVPLVNIHTCPAASAVRLPQAVGQLHHPEAGGRGPRWWGAIPGGSLTPRVRGGLPIGQAGWGPSGGGRWGRGIRAAGAPWAVVVVSGDAGDLETTLLLASTHGPRDQDWVEVKGQKGRARALGRGSGTPRTGGPHGGGIRAPGDI